MKDTTDATRLLSLHDCIDTTMIGGYEWDESHYETSVSTWLCWQYYTVVFTLLGVMKDTRDTRGLWKTLVTLPD